MDEAFRAGIKAFLNEARNTIVGNKLISPQARSPDFIALVENRLSDLLELLNNSEDQNLALFASQSVAHLVGLAHAAGENSPTAYLEAVRSYKTFQSGRLAAAGVAGRRQKNSHAREAVTAAALALARKYPNRTPHYISHQPDVLAAAAGKISAKTVERWVRQALTTTVASAEIPHDGGGEG